MKKIIKTIQLSSGAKVMHLKNDNCKVIRVQFVNEIINHKK